MAMMTTIPSQSSRGLHLSDEIGYEGEEPGDAEDEQVIAQGRTFFGFLFFCFFFLDVSGDGFFVLCHRFLCFGISLFFFRYFIFPFPARDEFIDLDGDRQGNKEGEIDPMTDVMRLAAPAKAVIFCTSSGNTATIEPTEAAIMLQNRCHRP